MTSSRTLTVKRGDDFQYQHGFMLNGGRYVDDLNVTNGSAVATSATADFVASDVGALVATSDGSGIVDGTTILSVDSATQITLDANADATGTVGATIRAKDCSGFSAHYAQYRKWEDEADTEMVSFSVDASRDAVGVFVLSLTDTQTELLTSDGVWDWQATIAGFGVRTLRGGRLALEKDTARP